MKGLDRLVPGVEHGQIENQWLSQAKVIPLNLSNISLWLAYFSLSLPFDSPY